jgi:hypothetical protein
VLRQAADRGTIKRDLNLEVVASVLMALADGFAWRRAADKSFNAEAAIPIVLKMIRTMLVEKEAL